VTAYNIVRDDLSGPEVAALLRLHLGEMHQWSPACKVHALPLERLREPDVAFWSAWETANAWRRSARSRISETAAASSSRCAPRPNTAAKARARRSCGI